MNKFITLLLFISLFQNGIAQEGIIPTYEYFTSESELTRWKDKAEEIVCYTYMDESFTKVELHSEFYKVLSKRKDGTKIYEGKVAKGLWIDEWIYYHPNGNPLFKAFYSKGIVQNDFKVYYPNGKVYTINNVGNFESSKGSYFELNEHGDTIEVRNYNKGELKNLIRYSEKTILEKIYYKSFSLDEHVDLFIKNRKGDVLLSGHFINGFAVGEWNCIDERTSDLKQKIFEIKDSIKIPDEIFFFKSTTDLDSITIPDLIKQPEFGGGEKVLFEQIRSKIRYPKYSLDNNLEGRIWVSFIVSQNGKIEYVSTNNIGPQSELTNAAIRAVQHLDNFSPGEFNGKAVRVKYILPIKFKLVD